MDDFPFGSHITKSSPNDAVILPVIDQVITLKSKRRRWLSLHSLMIHCISSHLNRNNNSKGRGIFLLLQSLYVLANMANQISVYCLSLHCSEKIESGDRNSCWQCLWSDNHGNVKWLLLTFLCLRLDTLVPGTYARILRNLSVNILKRDLCITFPISLGNKISFTYHMNQILVTAVEAVH